MKFSTQGKTCFHNREPLFSLQGPLFSLQGFLCEKTSQGNPCNENRVWACNVVALDMLVNNQLNSSLTKLIIAADIRHKKVVKFEFSFLTLCVYIFKNPPTQFLSHWESPEAVFCIDDLSFVPNQNKS